MAVLSAEAYARINEAYSDKGEGKRMALILTNEDVEQLLTMKDCIGVVEDAFIDLGRGQGVNIPRTDVLIPSSRSAGLTYYPKIMAGATQRSRVFALRINSDLWADGTERMVRVSIESEAQNKFCALVLLYSIDTCELLAICHSGFIQRMRVGATGGIGAKYLARKDATTVGLIGSSWQAGAQLLALHEVMIITHVKVYSPNRERRTGFAEEMSKVLGVQVQPVDTARECVKNVDIVDLATSAREPVIDGKWLEEGVHVHCIQPMELDNGTFLRSNVVVSNVRPFGSTGEYPYIQVFNMGEVSRQRQNIPGTPHLSVNWNNTPSLSELILGQAEGRTADNQITLHLNNVGVGIQFAAVGAKVYELAKEKGVGKEIPREWFLQTVQG